MKRDDKIALGVIAALLLLGRRRVTVPWGDPKLWMVPVPDLKVASSGVLYPAVVTQEWRATSPGVAGHYGVDLMYRRRVAGDVPALMGDHNGNALFFAPPGTPIIAARSGVLWSASKSNRGFQVVLDHGKPFATYYQHLDKLDVPLAQAGKVTETGKAFAVQAGDVIGTMGWDPTDPEGLRHLHFAVWYNGAGDSASVDPASVIGSWNRSTWTA